MEIPTDDIWKDDEQETGGGVSREGAAKREIKLSRPAVDQISMQQEKGLLDHQCLILNQFFISKGKN